MLCAAVCGYSGADVIKRGAGGRGAWKHVYSIAQIFFSNFLKSSHSFSNVLKASQLLCLVFQLVGMMLLLLSHNGK